MFIQGNLQDVFDALYDLGVINPALKASWAKIDSAQKKNPLRFRGAIDQLNKFAKTREGLVEGLRTMDQETLIFLAMEVARELVDFEERKLIH